MRVLVIIYDLFVLAGNVRAILIFADMFKRDGHDVKILYSNCRPTQDRYFKIEDIRKYHPIFYLTLDDFEETPAENFMETLKQYRRSYDLYFTGDGGFAYLNSQIGVREIFYIHWPDRPLRPTCSLWTNSTFSQKEILKTWHRYASVRYPAIWRIYRWKSWEERDIDIVFFGQVLEGKGLEKLKYFKNVPGRLVYMGARADRDVEKLIPSNITFISDVTLERAIDILSRSKVFIHLKEQEHFGIVVAEAAASGCALLVFSNGGPYTDIIRYGKYGLTYDSFREMIPNAMWLIEDPDLWKLYSRFALEAAEQFMADKRSFRIIQ